jgi:hypothetical protein
MHRPGMVSIWFFVGILLVVYGGLITAAGLYEFVSPPARPVVLAELHAGVWWGAILLVLGALYTHRFSPRRQK